VRLVIHYENHGSQKIEESDILYPTYAHLLQQIESYAPSSCQSKRQICFPCTKIEIASEGEIKKDIFPNIFGKGFRGRKVSEYILLFPFRWLQGVRCNMRERVGGGRGGNIQVILAEKTFPT
jgi:hypothetical protein